MTPLLYSTARTSYLQCNPHILKIPNIYMTQVVDKLATTSLHVLATHSRHACMPRLALVKIWEVSRESIRIFTKKLSYRSKKRHSQKEARNYSRKTFFPNEYETGNILPKTVLNYKISHIGPYIGPLVFCNFFIRNRQILTLLGKKVAISEISSELMKITYFHQTCETGSTLPKIVFHIKMNHIQHF